MNIAYFINGILPLRIGELGRVFLTSRANRQIPALETGGTIVVERLLDVFAVVLLLMFTMAIAPLPVEAQQAGAVGGIILVGGFAFLILLGRRRRPVMRWVERLETRSAWLRRFGLQRHVQSFLDGLSPILDPFTLFSAVFWTIASWIFSVLTNFTLMLAFFDEGALAPITLSIVFAAFAIALPVIPGNIGTYELSIIAAFSALGFGQADKITAFAFALHALNVLVNTATGFIGLFYEGISLGHLRSHLEQPQVNGEAKSAS